MNAENLRSELQQVLDNDVALRKEFTELKRSLSDYRNQLIMRDEDCKRLQVTIDVLNTKLVVMERDNTNYKSELTSFQELRSTIREQLDSKQQEIEARLEEIAGLREELAAISDSYEVRIADLKNSSESELERVSTGFNAEITELKTNTHYKENGIRDDYENRLSELTNQWADQEQSLRLGHEDELSALKQSHEDTIASLISNHEARVAELTTGNDESAESLRLTHRAKLIELEESHIQRTEELETAYRNEINSLRGALEEQRQTLTSNFNNSMDGLRLEFSERESTLIAQYEAQIEQLKNLSSGNLQEVSLSFQDQITSLREQHEAALAEIGATYEEKLSNTLIHSNSQNSRLSEELEKAQAENNGLNEKLRELSIHCDTQSTQLESGNLAISQLNLQLQQETERFAVISGEFESFKQNAALTAGEQVRELNTHVDNLSISHNEVVNRLNAQIADLSEEIKNMGLVFEKTTNQLSETETSLENKEQELLGVRNTIGELNVTLTTLQDQLSEKDNETENFKRQLEGSVQQVMEAKEVEYQKLLVENSSLINEINEVQDRLEARDAEMTLLRGELDEVRQHSVGKAEHFKETLSNKNFQLTNLEAANAGLQEELSQVKLELDQARLQLEHVSAPDPQLDELRALLENVSGERNQLLDEVQALQSGIAQLNEKTAAYETEIAELRNATKAEEQEAFIDRLFKQIDQMNDERLSLLDEKEQMAMQLLKMNETVGLLSQHVESEDIDVQNLNNHRKSVILAKNSGGVDEKSHLKGQINDLVREIDKCIALLSA